MNELIGNDLVMPNGTSVSTSDALASAQMVGLYFSAHWCPPCRMFTPQLAKNYSSSLHSKGLQIIFVSSDKDEGQFKAYHEEMPWPALPFADRARKNSLSKKFKVQGIPTLVILDAKTGLLVNANGRAQVSQDPTGENFPEGWIPRSVTSLLSSQPYESQSSSDKLSFNEISSSCDILGLYFSAHWCPPCRGFTPVLSSIYSEMKAEDGSSNRSARRFEVIFISSDNSESEFSEYFKEMPWLALPFAQRELAEELNERFEVEGIPSLILLDPKSGKILSSSAVGSVRAEGKAGFPWLPQPVSLLNNGTASTLVENRSVVMKVSDEHHAKSLLQTLLPVVKNWKDSSSPSYLKGCESLEFFVTDGHPLVTKIESFMGRPFPILAAFFLEENQVALSSLKNSTEISENTLKQFVESILNGAIKDEPLQPPTPPQASALSSSQGAGEISLSASQEGLVQQVMELGFSKEKAIEALFATDYDVSSAVSLLLNDQ